MLNLDPAKLLVIAVVAIILLGPDRLPQVARQVGAAWRSFNEFRHRMETEVRSTMPDLPPTHEIARLARSPSALLNKLSSMSDGDGNGTEANGAGAGTGDGGNGAVAGAGTEANGTSAAPGVGAGVGSNGDSSSLPDGAAAVGPVAERPAPTPDGVMSGADVVTEGAGSTPAPGPAPAATRPAPGPVSPAPSPEVITPGDPTLN